MALGLHNAMRGRPSAPTIAPTIDLAIRARSANSPTSIPCCSSKSTAFDSSTGVSARPPVAAWLPGPPASCIELRDGSTVDVLAHDAEGARPVEQCLYRHAQVSFSSSRRRQSAARGSWSQSSLAGAKNSAANAWA